MKKIFIFIIALFQITTFSGEGGSSGGPRLSGDTQMTLNRFIQGPGGTGGGPINLNDSQFIDKIDNIEIFDEVQFPETFDEKIDLLKRSGVQSIQLIDGQIISY